MQVADKDSISWHPAFLRALQLDFEAYLDVLHFEAEHPLTAEPMVIDVLVIKKDKGAVIDKPIAALFKQYNIFEFKSPADYLSADDFYKGYVYGCSYKIINQIKDIGDITLSFAAMKYPRKMIKHLEEVRGYKVTEHESGIYRITGDCMPMQVIETKRLSEQDSLYLTGLSNKLDARKLEKIMTAVKDVRTVDISAYMDVILRANIASMREVFGMENLTIEKVLEETGWTARGEARGRHKEKIEIARNFIKIGWDNAEQLAEMTGLDIATVKSLYAETRL